MILYVVRTLNIITDLGYVMNPPKSLVLFTYIRDGTCTYSLATDGLVGLGKGDHFWSMALLRRDDIKKNPIKNP